MIRDLVAFLVQDRLCASSKVLTRDTSASWRTPPTLPPESNCTPAAKQYPWTEVDLRQCKRVRSRGRFFNDSTRVYNCTGTNGECPAAGLRLTIRLPCTVRTLPCTVPAAPELPCMVRKRQCMTVSIFFLYLFSILKLGNGSNEVFLFFWSSKVGLVYFRSY